MKPPRVRRRGRGDSCSSTRRASGADRGRPAQGDGPRHRRGGMIRHAYMSVVMAGRDGSVGWRNHVQTLCFFSTGGEQTDAARRPKPCWRISWPFGPGCAGPFFFFFRFVTMQIWRRTKEWSRPDCAVGHSLERVTAREEDGARIGNTIVDQHVRTLGGGPRPTSAGDSPVSRGAVRRN